MELLGRGWGWCVKGWKWKGEPQRGGGSAVKIMLCNLFSAAGVLHLFKTEEKNSFAISSLCPEGPCLPQSRRSVLLSPACMLLSRGCDSETHTGGVGGEQTH